MTFPLPFSLTPSKLTAFKDCPLAFRYNYIDRIPQPPSQAAFKGTAVHAALESLFWECQPGERSVEKALFYLDFSLEQLFVTDDWSTMEQGGATKDAFTTSAMSFVQNYFLLENPNVINAIGLELLVETKNEKGLLTRGIIDRLDVESDGSITVTDYKTGRPPSEQFQNDKLGGVAFYAMLCEQVFGIRPARVQLLYLSEPLRIVVETSEQLTRGVSIQTKAAWNAIESACEKEDFRPRVGKACSWCSYQQYCPEKGGVLKDFVRLENVNVVEDESVVAQEIAAETAAEITELTS